jgi:DNA-binding transcriptional regulator GbsR (MarR family)
VPRDEQALRTAVEQSAAVLASAGFPKMPARVLVTLLVAERGGLTAGELGERLGVSAGGISGAVRYLELIGVVHRVAQPGSRRAHWELFDQSWYLALSGKGAIYTRIAETAEQAAAALDDPESLGARRIADMVAFFRFLNRRLPELMEEWQLERGRAAAGAVDLQ